jgi:hypothetical protein
MDKMTAMNVVRAARIGGGVLALWCCFMALVLAVVAVSDAGSIAGAVRDDVFVLLLFVADLSGLVLGLGALSCSLAAHNGSLARRTAMVVTFLANSYAVVVACAVIAVVSSAGHSVQIVFTAFAVVAVTVVWILLIRAGRAKFDHAVAALQ